MKTLLLTASIDGHTIKIMRVIASEMLYDHYDLFDIHTMADIDWAQYDHVIIGASIRYGHYHKNLYKFVNQNAKQLNQLKTSFFGVNLVARKENKNTPQTNSYTRKFLNKISWKPQKSAVFAGACSWSKYNYWQTKIIQLIMTITKGPANTDQDVEFTDWDDVRSFAKSL